MGFVHTDDESHKYIWLQNAEEVTIQYRVPDSTVKADISFELTHAYINVKLSGDDELLKGDLGGTVDVEESTWTLADNV